MWTLYARSLDSDSQRVIPLVAQQQWLVGRSSAADICIEWDRYISREHMRLTICNRGLKLECLPGARNRILHQSKTVDQCTIYSGDEILLGSTLVQVVQHAELEQETVASQEYSYHSEELKQQPEHSAAERFALLSTLPELLESNVRKEDFIETILNLLAQGVPDAEGVLILQQGDQTFENSSVELLNFFSRNQLPVPQISQRLWDRCHLQENGAVLHLWGMENESSSAISDATKIEYTASPCYNWAFCVPCELPGGKRSGVYIYGQSEQSDSEEKKRLEKERLDADVKFTNLTMSLTSAVVRGRQLEKQQALLRQFFPKEITDALRDDPGQAFLEPRDCELTVLFCDLSDFTSRAEKQSDNLYGFLKQVSEELECATAAILRQGGVIGDFHGDAVMGFWGWPFDCEQAEERACLAAIEIQQAFKLLQQKMADDKNAIRIGIASGRGIAGKIGTKDQMKVTAFGSVVNRAERLQGIGKQLHSAVTVEVTTVENLRKKKSKLHNKLSALELVKAKGLEKPLECFTLSLEK